MQAAGADKVALAGQDAGEVVECPGRLGVVVAQAGLADVKRAFVQGAGSSQVPLAGQDGSEAVEAVGGVGVVGVNTDTSPQFPGVYPEVIAVAALDQQDRRAIFPSGSSSNFGTNVDVAAPGLNIWSSVLNNGHGFKNGTSMAAPHATGVAALIWSRNRNLTNQQVRQILESTCDNIDATNPGFVGALGRGRINALAAVTAPQIFPAHVSYTAHLTGDGRADIVGFGERGVWVSLNQGNGTFGPVQKVVDNFAYDVGSWRVEKHPRFLADLTGDGQADIVGFGEAGVWVSLNGGKGVFPNPMKVINNFGHDAGAGSWRVHKHPRFVVGPR